MDVYQMTTKSEGMMIPGKLKWYAILALALWLAFSGVAAAEQLYVNENGWWRDGGVFNVSTAPIQAAVGAADAGDSIYVEGGDYNENVNVDKPRLTLEGAGADVVTVTVVDSDDHVFEVTANYVNISGFVVRGATDSNMAGVYLDNADYCNISENNVYGNYRGILLSSSNSNILVNNTISGNHGGIDMGSSSNYNMLTKNTVNSNDGYGIYLYSSSSNMLTSNTANSNNRGIYMTGDSNSNVLVNNIVSDNDVGIGIESSSNNTLENNTANSNIWGGIGLWHSSNNTLKSNTANSNGHGIHFYDTDNNNIACNWVQNNTQYGFRLYNADNNNIAYNLVQNNTERGFYIHSGSTGNDVSYNNIIENGNYNATSNGWEWQFYIDQYNPVEAKHNYWGAGMNGNTIDASIYDNEEGGWGEVEFYPFETEPVTPENIPPIASFTYYPLSPIVNQMVTFNASNSADSDGTITNYEWNFGDGNTTNTTEETITHFYISAEDYTVNLTVTDDDGAINSTAKAMTVYPPTTIYVPDDYAKIQWAVDNATAGDAIYVWNGSYIENVNVYKQLTLEGEGTDVVTVTAADPGDYVFEVTADYVNLSGFAVRGATDDDMAGIRLTNVDYCNIFENNVYGNDYGIRLYYSSDTTLTNNNANSNNDYGIYLYNADNNNLMNNTANKNHYGIWLFSSSDNNLTNNTANKNHHSGIWLRSSSNYNVLTSNNASNNDYGIWLSSSSGNTLTSNNANFNNWRDGIILSSSSGNTLTSNNASNNDYRGIWLSSSSGNTLTSNNASNNDYGIYLDNADNNNITCNLMRTNTKRGFYLTGGRTGNNISYNNIIENGNYNTMSGGWEWQFYINQYQPVEAKHNYWGAGMNDSTIDESIYDDDEGMGKVEFYPFETEPVPCAPTPEEPPAFTTTDAVIALQIAAGSRPPDLRWDVSGDGSVTSLDALMILQAAADSNT
jgi:parallel beta-helix repeat protein